MTGRAASTAVATAAHARRYAVAVVLVVLSLLTVVGPHLHQVTTETTSPGIVCRDARDCAVPPQPHQDQHHHTPTLAARRTDQQPRREVVVVPSFTLAAGIDAVSNLWTLGPYPATAALRPSPPPRAPGLRAPPVAA
jgi:hypothetical protein